MSADGLMRSPRVLQQRSLRAGSIAAADFGAGAPAAACWVESAHAPLSAEATEFAPPTWTSVSATVASGLQVTAVPAALAGLRFAPTLHRRAFLGLAILATYLGLFAGLALLLDSALGGSA